MKRIVPVTLAALALGTTLAWAATHSPLAPSLAPAAGMVCLDEADIAFHRDRSRNGISLTCDETVRARAVGGSAAGSVAR